MENKRDYYYQGKIYIDAIDEDFFPMCMAERLNNMKRYPVQGNHSFKDGEDVTGRYELKHQIRDFTVTNPVWQNVTLETYKSISEALCTKRIVALPLPASTGEGVKEKAVELVEKFKDVSFGDQPEIQLMFAKQCALICVDEILDEVRGISIMERETRKQRIQFYQHVRNHIQTL